MIAGRKETSAIGPINHDCSSCGEEGCKSRQIEKLKPHPQTTIRKTIAIVSGKGGVGKTLVTSLLGAELTKQGHKVAVMDADVTGPSIPQAFGVKGQASGDDTGIFAMRTKHVDPETFGYASESSDFGYSTKVPGYANSSMVLSAGTFTTTTYPLLRLSDIQACGQGQHPNFMELSEIRGMTGRLKKWCIVWRIQRKK